MNNLFCFEGARGSGKGTIISYLIQELKAISIEPIILRDSEYPEFEALKEQIRRKEIQKDKIVEKTAQVRADIYQKHIDPLLLTNKMIFLDRSYYTSAVWQSETKTDICTVLEANVSKGIPVAKKAFILYAPIEVLITRILQRKRQDVGERSFESIRQDQEKYLFIAQKYPECVLINTDKPVGAVAEEVLKYIK